MYCRNCGKYLQDGNKFCVSCGAQIETAQGKGDQPTYKKNKSAHSRGNKILLVILIVASVVALISGCLLIALAVNGTQDMDVWQEQYDLGVRYFSEGKYEEAVIAFLAAIEIDPARPDAYWGAAQTYVAMGDQTAAIQILQAGVQRTGSKDLQQELKNLTPSSDVDTAPEESLEQEEEPQATEAVQEESSPQNNRIVTSAYFDEYRFTGETQTRCAHIPRINLPDDRAAAANAQIYDTMYAELDQNVYSVIDDDWNAFWIGGMNYAWGENEAYVSVLSYCSLWADGYYYFVHNVSKESGELAEGDELIKSFGLSGEAYYAKIEAAVNAYYDSDRIRGYFGISDVTNADREALGSLEGMRQNTLAKENLKTAIPYISSGGDLCVVVTTEIPVGRGTFPTLLNLEKLTEEEIPYCNGDHAGETEWVNSNNVEATPNTVDQALIGNWTIDEEYTMAANGVSMLDIFGTSYKYGCGMCFGADDYFEYYIAAGHGGEGTFSIDENKILTDITQAETGRRIQDEMDIIVTDTTTRLVMQLGDYLIFWIRE